MKSKKQLEEVIDNAKKYIGIFSLFQMSMVVLYFGNLLALVWAEDRGLWVKILLTLILVNIPPFIFTVMVGRQANDAVSELQQMEEDNVAAPKR